MAKGRCEPVVVHRRARLFVERVRISYPHIGVQTLMPLAEVKLVRADIRKKGDRIGYIPVLAMMFQKVSKDWILSEDSDRI